MRDSKSSGKTPGAEHQQGKGATDRGSGPIHSPLDKGHVYNNAGSKKGK